MEAGTVHSLFVATGTPAFGMAMTLAGVGGGVAVAYLALARRSTRFSLRVFVGLIVLVVAARAGLSLAETPLAGEAVGILLDATMIGLTVAILWAARSRRRELGPTQGQSSR